jgi:hypothetical protein
MHGKRMRRAFLSIRVHPRHPRSKTRRMATKGTKHAKEERREDHCETRPRAVGGNTGFAFFLRPLRFFVAITSLPHQANREADIRHSPLSTVLLLYPLAQRGRLTADDAD